MCVFFVFRIKEWTEQMQKELITLIDTASGMQHLVQVRFMFRSDQKSLITYGLCFTEGDLRIQKMVR